MRNKRYDFYKGLLMLGVVYGHVLTLLQDGTGETFLIHQFIRTYDMPMFAFISGIFLKRSCEKHTITVNLLNKIGGILLPCLIWEFIFNLVGGRITMSAGRYWYTYSIFYVMTIMILINWISRKNNYLRFMLFILGIALFHTFIIDRYKIGFLFAPAVVGYYYEGSWIQIKENSNSRLSTLIKCTIVFVFVLAQCFWKIDYNVWNAGCDILKDSNHVGNILIVTYRFGIGVLGCFTMKWFFDMLYDFFSLKRNFTETTAFDHICKLGMITLEIYILQCELVKFGKRLVHVFVELAGDNLFSMNTGLLINIIAPTVTVVSLYFLFFVLCLIKKIPYLGPCSFNIPLKRILVDNG